MAANSNLHVFLPYNVSSSSSAKNSPASIPNGFKSQEVLRPWNKMFAKKKTNSVFPSNEKHLMSNRPPLEKPESNVHGAGQSCASSFQLSVCATFNSSFENRQTLPKVAASNLLSQSNSVLSNKKHSVEKKSPKSSLPMNGGDATCSGSILSENCYSKCRKSPKSQPDSCNGDSLLNQSEDDGMTFSRIIGFHGNNDNSCLPSTIRNPNKAICTIDAKSSQILTANEMACALFGYDRADMIRKRLIDLIQLKKKDEKTLMESYLEPNGQIISITGKVVEAVDKNGLVLPVSLWMKRLDYNKKSRCLVAMEPAHRLVCSMFFDMKGTILSCDDKLSYLYGFTDSEDMIGMNINQLIPGFQLPNSGYRISKNVKKQRATGRSLDGSVFPLSIHVQSVNITSSGEEEEEEEEEEEDGGRKRRVEDRKNKSCCRKSSFSTKSDYVFEAIICVFSNITGLITFFPDGTIHSVNHHFALMLFGYSNLELVGKNVSVLIPDFYSIVSSLNLQKDKIPPISPVNSSVTRSSIGEIFSPAKIKKKAAKLHCPDLMSVTEKRRFSDVTSDPRTASKEWQNHLPELKPKGSSTPYRMSTHLKLNEITHNSNEDLKMPFEKQLKSMRPIPFDPQYSDIESCSEDEEHSLQPIKALPNGSSPHMDTTSSQSNQSPSNPTNSNSQTMPSETNTIESLETACKNLKLSSAEDSSGKNSNSRNGFCSKEEFSSSGNSKTIPGNKPSSEIGSNSKDSSSFTKDQTKESQTFNSSSSSSPVTSSPKDKDLNFSRTSDSIIRLEPELALIDAKMEALCVDCNSSLTGYSSAETEDEDSETEKKNHFRMTNSSTNLVPPNNLRFTPDQNLVPPEKICGACVPKIIPKEELGVGSNPKATTTTAITACLSSSSSSSPTAQKDGLKTVPSPKKKFSEKTKIERMIASPETLDSDEDSFEFLEREIEKTCQKKEMLNGEAHHFLDELDSSLELEEEGHDDKNLFIQTTPLNNINSLIKDDVGNLFLKSSSPKKINVTPETEQAPEVESSLDVILGSSGAFKKLLRHNYRKEALQNSLLQKQTHNDKNHNNNVCVLDGEDGTVQENLSALDENTDGDFAGLCQHKDGSMININFSVNPMHLESGELMFCLWLSQDIDKNSLHNFTIDFPKSSNENSINVSDPQVHSSLTPEGIKTADRAEESYPPCKAFDRNYQNLRTIGHGAFGFVVESLEESTKLEVIVKYILRSKILSENWRDDPSLGRIPLEVSLLSQLSHPNIVQVLNVFNSQDYVLMVMEKHGSGMDLFEFIEHKPTMDEGLHSYIFRQLVSAIAYLHRCGIVHRDIKDENIIVNEHFHIKLIDFGSAAYMEEGKMFATFCGTVEYCSPEVLMGNGYDGPELEVWSMGVTLYTLVYGENPFFTVDDILACNFKPPFQVSEYLTDLLCWMLLPDPADRITVEELETDAWVFQAIDMTQYSWQEIMALPDGPTVPDYEVIYEDDSSLYEDKTDMLIPSSSSVHSKSTKFPSHRQHFMSF